MSPTKSSAFLDALSKRVLVYDGAMGTSLQALELEPHDFGDPKLDGWIDGLVLYRPELISEIHRSFLDVGADVLETCTFQSSRLRLEEWNHGERTLELNRVAAELARAAADEFSTPEKPRFVAGSIGPSGFLPSSSDPTLGKVDFRQLFEAFTEQAQGLLQGGADLLVIETAQDILEVKASIFGAREAMAREGREVPIQASVSLDISGRMLLGTDPMAVATILNSLRVDVIGLNCSTGPEYMHEPLRILAQNCPVPISCIPNAGIPQNVDGKPHFPLQAVPMAEQLEKFVVELGVGAVGGCCGSTPQHIAELVARVGSRTPAPREVDTTPRIASSMTAYDIHQEPAPLLVGERVNAQGSRKVKELLLNDDYDSIVEIGRLQVEGGAHALDVCVAVTERPDEADQIQRLTKNLQMAVSVPLCFDSTDADVLRAGLETYPGRAIVNSVNMENGRARCDAVLPLVRDHGAVVVALTIDEVGMAKTRDRKLEIAQRIADLAKNDFDIDHDQLLFDALTFTLATGEKEWIDSAVETIEGIRLIKKAMPGVATILGVSNVSFGLQKHARPTLNSVFLYHCIQAGLDAAIINPAHVVPYGEIGAQERELAEDLIFNRREDALARYIEHYEENTNDGVEELADPFEGLAPPERIHQQILRRKKDGIEDQIDLALKERDPVAVLNEILLPAMKDVGDRFGAGELILPFVLQSAEVMKRAVKHLEQFLEKKEGYTKGTVVIATVYGDVHDIGKNLVNTILSNNGYTVHDLGKQVPLTTIIEKAVEVKADVIGLSALLVSTSKQMPLCLQELDSRGLEFPVIIGGAAINRGFGRRILYLDGQRTYDPGVFYCKDAFEGLETVDQLIDDERRTPLVAKIHEEAATHKVKEAQKVQRRADEASTVGPQPARSTTRSDVKLPVPPFWGHKALKGIALTEVYPHIDRNSLFKMSWQFKGVHDDTRWAELVRDELEPRLEKSMSEATQDGWLDLQAVYGYWPSAADGDSVVIFDPQDHDREIGRFAFPRQSAQNRLCLADYVRPKDQLNGDERDVIALQIVTTGPAASELSNRLQRDGEYDDMLRIHGFATQMAEATAEYIHQRIRQELAIGDDQGRRYSWGYPACPDLEDHKVFFDVVPADLIGVELTEGFQLNPEQSTAAIVMHHPEARYFAVYTAQSALDGPGAPEAAA